MSASCTVDRASPLPPIVGSVERADRADRRSAPPGRSAIPHRDLVVAAGARPTRRVAIGAATLAAVTSGVDAAGALREAEPSSPRPRARSVDALALDVRAQIGARPTGRRSMRARAGTPRRPPHPSTATTASRFARLRLRCRRSASRPLSPARAPGGRRDRRRANARRRPSTGAPAASPTMRRRPAMRPGGRDGGPRLAPRPRRRGAAAPQRSRASSSPHGR